MISPISSLAHFFIIGIILSFLFHITLVPVVIDLASGLDEYLESVHDAVISEQFVLDEVLQILAIRITKRFIFLFRASKIALKVPSVSDCRPFLAKCLYGSFRFFTFVYNSKVGLNFYNKSFPNAKDFDNNILYFPFINNLILITPHKVIFKEPFDPVQGLPFEQRDYLKDLFDLKSKAISIKLNV